MPRLSTLQKFSVDVPEFFNWGFDVIDSYARDPKKTALIYSDEKGRREEYSFAEVSQKSNQIANYLSKKGVRMGDAVLLMLPNIPTLWELMVALLKIGAKIIPSATLLTTKDIEYRINTADVKAIITNGENQDKFSDSQSHVRLRGLITKYDFESSSTDAFVDDGHEWFKLEEAYNTEEKNFSPSSETRSTDPALIYFTSGTVGMPKMVVHTQASYPLGHKATALWLGLEENMLHWNISSPGWAKHGWSSVFAPWSVGATTFAYNYKGRFEAADHLRKIGEYGVNSLCAPPTVWRMFILQDIAKFDLSSLRHCSSAGEPLNPEVINRFKKITGLTIKDGYGQTETVVVIANFPEVEVKPGSMGVANPLYQVEIVDEDGDPLGPNEEGNIAIRISPQRPFALVTGYSNAPDRNSEAFRDSWYYTGDRAYRDKDGYFWFVGRSDDVFKSAGYRIGPFEVESALIKHPSVAEAAVVPSFDELRGSVVKAFVVLKNGYEPTQELANELAAFVAQETAPFKHPRRIEFVASLDPVKTISGKIRRKELRQIENREAQRKFEGRAYTTNIQWNPN